MRRNLPIVIATFVIIFLLDSVEVIAQDDITLRIYGEPGPDCTNPDNSWEFCLYSRSVTDIWYENHPNIRIEWINVGWDAELYVALQNAIEEGNPPDITIGESFLPLMMREGLLLPLNLSAEVRENIVPGTIAYVTDSDNLIYGVPIFTGVFALEINPDVFYAAGLIPEVVELKTWDEVVSASTIITENGNDNYYGHSILGPTNLPAAALFRFAPYLYMTGADFCNMPDCTIPTLNDPQAVEAYEFFRALYKTTSAELTFNGEEGYILSQLFNGSSAMQTAGSWHISWATSSGCGDCRYLPLPMPTKNTEPTNVVVGNAIYSALATTEYPEEARMFLEFLVTDELQHRVLWTGVGGRLPATYSALGIIQEVAQGENLEMIPDFWTNELNHTHDEAISFAKDYIPFISQLVNTDLRTLPFWNIEMSELWNEMFREVLVSERPVQEILDEYQIEAEEIMGILSKG